jgi:nicotinamidase-related amidase
MNKQSIADSALLVIDAQDSFKAGARWARRSNVDFERNVGALIDAYREAGLPVLFVLHSDTDGAFHVTSPYYKLMDFITRRENEPLLHKNTRNAFTSTDLRQRLEALGVKRIVITGIQTEQCCETTARLGADLGYDVDFVTEATMTFPILNRETGAELSTHDVVERTEYALRDRFARIVRVADVVAELEGALASSSR